MQRDYLNKLSEKDCYYMKNGIIFLAKKHVMLIFDVGDI